MNRLRFGIMCRSLTLPAWQAACVRALVEGQVADPILLILERAAPDLSGRWRKLLRDPDRLLFRLYNHLLVRPLVKALRPTDMTALLGRLPQIACRVVTENGGERRFSAENLQDIRRHDLDFVLEFACNGGTGDILRATRYGIWSYDRGDPAGFWELFYDRHDTGVVLRRRSERSDQGAPLFQGRFRTAITYRGNLERTYGETADWPSLCARRIVDGDTGFLSAEPETSRGPVLGPPTNREFLRFVGRQTRRIAARLARALIFADDWNVGVAFWPKERLLRGATTADVLWAQASGHGGCLADPMVLEDPGGTRVFAEQFDHVRHGRIVSLSWPERFAADAARLEFDPGSHVSYPFVFAHQGEVFLAPETRSLGCLLLLRRTNDGRWQEFCRVAEDVALTDPTLVQRDGRWWLFCCDGRSVPDTRLVIYNAERLGGPWQPHAGNPVKFDVRSARPAGPLFEVAGVLYRPAQDCAGSYGAAVTINRIDRLTPRDFAETAVARLEPAASCPYPDGVHTVVVGDGRIFVDGKRRRLRPGLALARLRQIWARQRAAALVDPLGLRPLREARR